MAPAALSSVDEVLDPFFAAIIGGMTFWIAQNTLVKLTRSVSSKVSPSNSVSGVKPPVSPALANRP